MSDHIPRPTITKNCAFCGAEFQTKNNNYKYCSPECRQIGYAQTQKEAARRWRKNNPEKARDKQRRYREKYFAKVRESNRLRMREWREQNTEESRTKAKEYYERNAEERRAYQQEYRRKYPRRVKAQQAVKLAIMRGDIPSATDCECVRCGEPATEYHHWSYSRDAWLDVEPMCPTCHARADQERIQNE